MPIPTYKDLMLPLLKRAAAAPNEINVPTLLPALAQDFGLTPEEVEERLASGRETVLANRCHWAQTYLRRAGLLESVRRGFFGVTERGRQLIAERPERIDGEVLRRYPEFAAWVQASRQRPTGDAPTTINVAAWQFVGYRGNFEHRPALVKPTQMTLSVRSCSVPNAGTYRAFRALVVSGQIDAAVT